MSTENKSMIPFCKCRRCEWIEKNAGGFDFCYKDKESPYGEGRFKPHCTLYKRERLFPVLSKIKLWIHKLFR